MTRSASARLADEAVAAENVFRARWRLSSLRRVDPELHDRLLEQRALFDDALFADDGEREVQSAAMLRGWRAATQAMSAVDAPDDAFLYGTDPASGLVVAIGDEPAKAVLKLKEGHRIVVVTPEEVARMIAANPLLAQAKAAFPEAELVAA